MKAPRNIFLISLLLTAWFVCSNVLLQKVSLIPSYEYGILVQEDNTGQETELRRGVIDTSHCIETGIQSHSSGTQASLGTKRTAGSSSSRIPVSAVLFSKSPQGKIPLIINTYKEVTFAACHSRDFYVIGLRHLII